MTPRPRMQVARLLMGRAMEDETARAQLIQARTELED